MWDKGHDKQDMRTGMQDMGIGDGIWNVGCSLQLCADCHCPLIQAEREALDREDQEGAWHCPAHLSLTG